VLDVLLCPVRDVMTPVDLLGRIQSLNIECMKCDRRVAADWPRTKAAARSDRCDVGA